MTFSPTSVELHSGVITGLSPHPCAPLTTSIDAHPRRVLEAVLAKALAEGPCAVQFSGGRDSSLVLAVAVEVAREGGFEAPRAISVRYPGIHSADESAWQDLVVEHLGVEHEIVEVPHGGNELCSPLGISMLMRHGPLMPPPSGVSLGRLGERVAGCTLLTGQGGDEVLGPSRITPFVAYCRRRRRPTKQSVRALAPLLLPRPARRVVEKRRLVAERESTWLHPWAERQVSGGLLWTHLDLPWDWRRARWQTTRSRMWAVGSRALEAVGAGLGLRIRDPLMDADFISSVSGFGGPLGLTTRAEAMRVLAGDLLPASVLTRSTKARFNEAYAGDGVRAFARSWDGSGVDARIVDVDRLRAAWREPEIPAAALAPLQLALLAAHGQPFEPDPTEML